MSSPLAVFPAHADPASINSGFDDVHPLHPRPHGLAPGTPASAPDGLLTTRRVRPAKPAGRARPRTRPRAAARVSEPAARGQLAQRGLQQTHEPAWVAQVRRDVQHDVQCDFSGAQSDGRRRRSVACDESKQEPQREPGPIQLAQEPEREVELWFSLPPKGDRPTNSAGIRLSLWVCMWYLNEMARTGALKLYCNELHVT